MPTEWGGNPGQRGQQAKRMKEPGQGRGDSGQKEGEGAWPDQQQEREESSRSTGLLERRRLLQGMWTQPAAFENGNF